MSFLTQFAQMYHYYEPQPYQTERAADVAAAGVILVFVFFAIAAAVAGYVVTAYLLGRIFKKAGEKPWKAWVPVYNNWVLLELGGQQGFWAVLAFIPIVNIVALVFTCIAFYNIGLRFGKDGAFVLLAIFLPIVWLIWLAFDSSTWQKAKTAGAPAKPAAQK